MKYPLQTLIAVATLSLGVMRTASAAKPGVIEEAELENSTFKKDWDYEFEINDADGNVSSVCSSQPGASSSMLNRWFQFCRWSARPSFHTTYKRYQVSFPTFLISLLDRHKTEHWVQLPT